MNVRDSFAVMALLLAATASCKSDKPKGAAIASASVNPYAIDEEDIPTSVDFEEEAAREITPATLEAEIAKMENELE